MSRVCQFCEKILSPNDIGCVSQVNGELICEKCIKRCNQMILSRGKAEKANKKIKKMVPKEIKAELDKHIIGQDEAKVSIAIAVYNHYKRMNIKSDVKIAKSNVLLLGPTGSGKTLIAQTVAKLLDVPFAIADCTSLTEAGYVGEDVENVLYKLLNAADGDVSKAEKGIVFLDEIDKIACSRLGANLSKDPSGEGVQQALLKLIEGTVANVSSSGGRKNPNDKFIEINTENILFICGGAFQGLESIINKRVQTKTTSIGFGANVEKEKDKTVGEAFKEVSTEDLIEFGLIPELIGRLPIVVSLDELTEDAMVEILTKPKNSLVNQYKEIFKYDGVDLDFTTESLRDIARETMKRKTGARGLRGILEEILKQSMFTIPSDGDVVKCIVKEGGKIDLIRKEGQKTAC